MNAKNILRMAGITFDVLNAIYLQTKFGGDKAAATLAGIRALLDRLYDGFEGKITPEAIEAQIDAMRSKLSDNDLAADTALNNKFGG